LLLVVVVVIEDIARETFHGKLNQESQSFAKISASAFCLPPPPLDPSNFPSNYAQGASSVNKSTTADDKGRIKQLTKVHTHTLMQIKVRSNCS